MYLIKNSLGFLSLLSCQMCLVLSTATESTGGTTTENSGDTTTESSGVYCPYVFDILPCVCTENGIGFVNIDCSAAMSTEEIEQAFLANFPLQNLNRFTLKQNVAITMMNKNLFNDVSFRHIIIQYTNINSIDTSFFDTSFATLLTLNCSYNVFVTFPLDDLARLTSLTELNLGNNALTSIPQLSSTTIMVMNFDHNSIKTVNNFAFSDCTALKFLYMSNNLILELPTSTFVGAKALEIIWLPYNQLASLRTGVFSGLPNVTTISVGGNPLTLIEDASFVDLPLLGYVDIADTQLTILRRDTFIDVPGIFELEVYNSLLQSVEPFTFSDFAAEFINIDFEFNSISHLVKDAFTGIVQGNVNLYGNSISVIDAEAFRVLTNSNINIEYNQISTLDETWLRSILEAENNVNVNANPLICGCDLLWLFQSPNFFDQLIDDPACGNGTLLSDLDYAYYFTNC